jgi:uncharacterized PurR-regulated membrane protein YhhQ (DUF165 family)
MRNRGWAAVAALTFVGLVVASNWLTIRYGPVLGGWVIAGTFTAGLVLAARDGIREAAGPEWRAWVWGAILAGALLSATMTYTAGGFPGGPTPLRLALASGIAFAVSEIADTFVYEPLRQSGRLRALAWSNAVGAVVDSVLFLSLAGFPLWPTALGQVGVKWLMAVALPLLVVKTAQAALVRVKA